MSTRIGDPRVAADNRGEPHALHAPNAPAPQHSAHPARSHYEGVKRSAHLRVARHTGPHPAQPSKTPKVKHKASPPQVWSRPATGQVVGPPLPTATIAGARPVRGIDTPPSVDAPARTGPPKKLAMIGDSHTPHILDGITAAAPHDLKTLPPVFQVGSQMRKWVPGVKSTSAGTSARIAKVEGLLKQHPDEVAISLGTNDGGDYYPQIKDDPHAKKLWNDDPIRRNVRLLVGKVRDSGSRLTWVLPPATRDDLTSGERAGVDRAREVIRNELGRIQEQIDADTTRRGAPPYKINVVDISRTSLPMPSGLHPSPDGYNTWGAAVWKSYVP